MASIAFSFHGNKRIILALNWQYQKMSNCEHFMTVFHMFLPAFVICGHAH